MSSLKKLLPALGLALTLGACASDIRPEGEGPLASIHTGLTQDEVRGIAGSPGNYTNDARGSMWVYSYTDTQGYQSEFDVTFDKAGVVTDTYRQRIRS